jgi:hypothetical protein
VTLIPASLICKPQKPDWLFKFLERRYDQHFGGVKLYSQDGPLSIQQSFEKMQIAAEWKPELLNLQPAPHWGGLSPRRQYLQGRPKTYIF